MTKSEKKIAYTAAGAVTGGVLGFALGVAKIPLEIGAALTSPISYPAIGMVSGLVNKPCGEYETAKNAAVGLAVGCCLVPFAPVILACTPFNPLAWSAFGAGLGGYIGYKEVK